MIKYLILILLISSLVFLLLNWSIGFKKNKLIIAAIMIFFFVMSYLTGSFFQKRYTIPIQTASALTAKTIEDANWIKKNDSRYFTMHEIDVIPDEAAKKILTQLLNECNASDTILYYPYEARVKFNNLNVWAHRTQGQHKIFLVTPATK